MMEENGDISYFGDSFQCHTVFSDLLDRMDMVSEVMTYEDQMYKDIARKQNTINAKADLESSKTQWSRPLPIFSPPSDLQSQVIAPARLSSQLIPTLPPSMQRKDALKADEDNVAQQIKDAQDQLDAQQAAAAPRCRCR